MPEKTGLGRLKRLSKVTEPVNQRAGYFVSQGNAWFYCILANDLKMNNNKNKQTNSVPPTLQRSNAVISQVGLNLST